MTGKHFGWHKRWAIHPTTQHLHHDSGVIVALRPATGAPGAVRAELQPCEEALRALADKNGPHNTPKMLARLLEEAVKLRNPTPLQLDTDSGPTALATDPAATEVPKTSRGGVREGAGRKAIDGVAGERKTLTLDADTLAAFAKLGGGSLSVGAREAARRLAALGQLDISPSPVGCSDEAPLPPVVDSGDVASKKKPRRGAGA